jgi:hypothetical protein
VNPSHLYDRALQDAMPAEPPADENVVPLRRTLGA